jgi:hypothetical protein
VSLQVRKGHDWVRVEQGRPWGLLLHTRERVRARRRGASVQQCALLQEEHLLLLLLQAIDARNQSGHTCCTIAPCKDVWDAIL